MAQGKFKCLWNDHQLLPVFPCISPVSCSSPLTCACSLGGFKKSTQTNSEAALSQRQKKAAPLKAGTIVRKPKLGKAAAKAKTLIKKLNAGSIQRCESQLAQKAGKMRIVSNPPKADKKDVKGNKKK